MEALRQIATTSLFMQNEQKPSLNRIVPIIKEPGNITEHISKKTELSGNDGAKYKEKQQSLITEDVEDITGITTTYPNKEISIPAESTIKKALTDGATSKLSRQRIAINHTPFSQPSPTYCSSSTGLHDISSSWGRVETILKTPTVTPAETLSKSAIFKQLNKENHKSTEAGHEDFSKTATCEASSDPSSKISLYTSGEVIKFNALNVQTCPSEHFLPGQIEEATIDEPVVIHSENIKLQSPPSGFSNVSCIFASHFSPPDNVSEIPSAFSASQTTIPHNLSLSDTSSGATDTNITNISHNNQPEMNHSLNIFEPELLLSPAKLGQ